MGLACMQLPCHANTMQIQSCKNTVFAWYLHGSCIMHIYSWIESPCQNRYTHFLSGCRKARTNPRPATVVSERAASSPACTLLRNSKIHKLLTHDQHDLATHAKVYKRIRVRLDRAVPTHLRSSKSELFWPRVCFFQTPFFQGSRCAGQHGTHREIHRESKFPSCRLYKSPSPRDASLPRLLFFA